MEGGALAWGGGDGEVSVCGLHALAHRAQAEFFAVLMLAEGGLHVEASAVVCDGHVQVAAQ